jgi:hypothetical protein
VGASIIFEEVAVHDGRFLLKVPYQSKGWYVVVDEPGEVPTIVGPVQVDLNQRKELNIVCTDGGALRGRVKDIPPGLDHNLWVVAFTKTGYRAETRVLPDGTFRFGSLPSGEYGLKVGHDAYTDSETQVAAPTHEKWTKEETDAFNKAWNAPADPWQRAMVVRVEAGREKSGVELKLP